MNENENDEMKRQTALLGEMSRAQQQSTEATIRAMTAMTEAMRNTAAKMDEAATSAKKSAEDAEKAANSEETKQKQIAEATDRMMGTLSTQLGMIKNKANEATGVLNSITGWLDRTTKMDIDGLINKQEIAKFMEKNPSREAMDDFVKRKEALARGRAFGAESAAMGSDIMLGANDPGKVLEKVLGNFTSEMKQGGILGMLFHGLDKAEEWETVGQQISQGFDAAGKSGMELRGKLQGLANEGNNFGTWTKEGLRSMVDAFAEVGTGADEALKPIEELGKGTHRSALEVTGMLDMMYDTAQGTFAKFASTMKKEFMTTAQDAAMLLKDLAKSGTDAGMSGTAFISSVMQNTAGIRAYGDNLRFVAEAQLKFQRAAAEKMGVSMSAAQDVGSRGIGGMLSGLGAMSDGMMAFLGQNMGYDRKKDGGEEDPLGIIFKMRTGMKYEGKDAQSEHMGKLMDAVKGMLGDIGDIKNMSVSELAGMAGRVTGITDVDAQAALALSLKDMAKDGKLSTESTKNMERALATEGQKRHATDNMLAQIRDAIAKMSLAMIEVIGGGLKWLGGSLKSFIGQMVAVFDSNTGAKMILEGDAMAEAGQFNLSNGMDRAMKSARAAGVSAANDISDMSEPATRINDKDTKVITQAQIDAKAKELSLLNRVAIAVEAVAVHSKSAKDIAGP